MNMIYDNIDIHVCIERERGRERERDTEEPKIGMLYCVMLYHIIYIYIIKICKYPKYDDNA